MYPPPRSLFRKFHFWPVIENFDPRVVACMDTWQARNRSGMPMGASQRAPANRIFPFLPQLCPGGYSGNFSFRSLPQPYHQSAMATAAQKIEDDLDRQVDLVWDLTEDSDFATLSQKASRLSAQIEVHQALEPTAQQLQKSAALPYAQSRLSKFLEALFGKNEDPRLSKLMEAIRGGRDGEADRELGNFEYEAFMLISISYTPLDITRMSQTKFECLIDTVPKYLQRRNFPPRWIFRNEIQMSIASKAHLQAAASFRKGLSTTNRLIRQE